MVVYLFVSWVRSASEIALLMSAESSLREREIWLEPEADGILPDILMGEGGKVLVEEIEEEGGEFVSVVKFNTMGAMSKH